MKQLIIIVLVFGFSLSSLSQSGNSVIASAGGSDSKSGINLSWTLGELMVPAYTGSNLTLAHGFQPQLFITSVEEKIGVQLVVKVYPNPAGDRLMLQFDEAVEAGMTVAFIDGNGKTVLSAVIDKGISESNLDLNSLTPGIYFMKITRGSLVNVYKVVKL